MVSRPTFKLGAGLQLGQTGRNVLVDHLRIAIGGKGILLERFHPAFAGGFEPGLLRLRRVDDAALERRLLPRFGRLAIHPRGLSGEAFAILKDRLVDALLIVRPAVDGRLSLFEQKAAVRVVLEVAQAVGQRNVTVLGLRFRFERADTHHGIAHAIDHLGPAIDDWWQDLGTLSLHPAVRDAVVDGVREQLAGVSTDTIVKERDALLIRLLEMKAAASSLP